MLLFLWIIGAMGVAYAAQLRGRTALVWFVAGMALTPIGGWLLLSTCNKRGWFVRL